MKEESKRSLFEKSSAKTFLIFTRDFATSPGNRKVFAELFSKSDRLLTP